MVLGKIILYTDGKICTIRHHYATILVTSENYIFMAWYTESKMIP